MEGGTEEGKKKERLKNNLYETIFYALYWMISDALHKYCLETVVKMSQRHLYANESMVANHVSNLSCTFTGATVFLTFGQ